MRDHSSRLILRAGLAMTIALYQAPASAAGIPSATDACLGGKTETTPSTEFELSDEGRAVRHTRTTLEWQRCSLGQTWEAKSNGCTGRPKTFTWDKAAKMAAALKDKWRIPSGEELLTIVEHCHLSPAVNPQVFPNTPAALFWTSSADTGGLNRAWSVSFFSGSPYRASKTLNGRIRLVRGALTQTAKP